VDRSLSYKEIVIKKIAIEFFVRRLIQVGILAFLFFLPTSAYFHASISRPVMRSQSGRLIRNAIRRRSGYGFSKRNAEPRTERILLAREKRPADDSVCLIGLHVITDTEMFTIFTKYLLLGIYLVKI